MRGKSHKPGAAASPGFFAGLAKRLPIPPALPILLANPAEKVLRRFDDCAVCEGLPQFDGLFKAGRSIMWVQGKMRCAGNESCRGSPNKGDFKMENKTGRDWKQKINDEAEEMKLKAQAKAADFAGDSRTKVTREAQAKAKQISNDTREEYEQQQKNIKKEMND